MLRHIESVIEHGKRSQNRSAICYLLSRRPITWMLFFRDGGQGIQGQYFKDLTDYPNHATCHTVKMPDTQQTQLPVPGPNLNYKNAGSTQHSNSTNAICFLFLLLFSLTKPSSLPSRIISLQHPVLTLVRLTESVAPLLPHPLHLSHFSDCLLELLHSGPVVLDIVLLNLLHVMVGLGPVHAFGILPREVSKEADHG